MKTPIQELIEVLKKEAQYISDNDHIEDRTYRRGLREAIQNAESMLEKEKEVMCEFAFRFNHDAFNENYIKAEFEETFKTKEK